MSAQIKQSYVSPQARWALIKTDHPNAKKSFKIVAAAKLADYGIDIPEEFRKGFDRFVICTISIPGQDDVIGFKEIANKDKRDPATLTALNTKALGRAAWGAGYPSDTGDLRAVLLWRRRMGELERELDGPAAVGAAEPLTAVDGPAAVAAIGAGAAVDPDEDYLDPDDDYVDPDDVHGAADADDTDSEVTDGEIVEDEVADDDPPTQSTTDQLRGLLTDLAAAKRQKALKDWCGEQGHKWSSPRTEAEARAIIQHGSALLEEADVAKAS